MSDFKIAMDWAESDDKDVILRKTTANLSINVDGTYLTQNINGWTMSPQDSILVSLYPLAKWFAYYWWRLENEYLPIDNRKPDYDWRSAHEVGAANHGYVWPKVLFVSDGEFINIWSDLVPTPLQSVNYIGKLDAVKSVSIEMFQKEVESLIETTISRVSGIDSSLPELWKIVCDERKDPVLSNKRKLEAVLGYDPEECPEGILERVLLFKERVGASSIKEIAPFLKSDDGLKTNLQNARGLDCEPQINQGQINIDTRVNPFPWQQGVSAAWMLRNLVGIGTDDIIDNGKLLDLLGVASRGLADYNDIAIDIPISVGKNEHNGKWSFVPRAKGFETGQRFELARLLGDSILFKDSNREWLVTSDYKSSRQKAQRAFAGEFLCPIAALKEFLADDYSETKRDKAARHFNVSIQTIDTLLLNNGIIEHDDKAFPYSA